jgi:hypothetical protein
VKFVLAVQGVGEVVNALSGDEMIGTEMDLC